MGSSSTTGARSAWAVTTPWTTFPCSAPPTMTNWPKSTTAGKPWPAIAAPEGPVSSRGQRLRPEATARRQPVATATLQPVATARPRPRHGRWPPPRHGREPRVAGGGRGEPPSPGLIGSGRTLSRGRGARATRPRRRWPRPGDSQWPPPRHGRPATAAPRPRATGSGRRARRAPLPGTHRLGSDVVPGTGGARHPPAEPMATAAPRPVATGSGTTRASSWAPARARRTCGWPTSST